MAPKNNNWTVFHFNKFSHNISYFKGMKIVGATCSTERGAEYVFQDGKIDPKTDTIVYNCICKGASSLFVGANNMVCVIHYWICPITS